MASSPGHRGGGGRLLVMESHNKFIHITQLIPEGVAAGVVQNLQNAGIYTCNGLLLHSKENIMVLAGLSEIDVDNIIMLAEKLLKITSVGITTGSQALSDGQHEDQGIQTHIDDMNTCDDLHFVASMNRYLDQYHDVDRETFGNDLNSAEHFSNQLSDMLGEVPMNVCEIREEFLSKAKIAKELKHYDVMLNALWGIVMLHLELTVEEQNLLLAAYRHLIVENIEALEVLKSLKLESKDDTVHMKTLTEYDNKTATILKNICLNAIEVLKNHILPFCSVPENKGFYLKIIGDCVWLISEYKSKETKLLNISLRTYEVAMLIMDNAEISRCNALRLSLDLNSSALLHDNLQLYERASEVASEAIGSCLSEPLPDDSNLIMDLLRDNVMHWASDEAVTEDHYSMHLNHLLLRTQPPSPVLSEDPVIADTIVGELGDTAVQQNELEDDVPDGQLGGQVGEHEVVNPEPIENEVQAEVNELAVENEEYAEVNELPVEDQGVNLTIIQVAREPNLALEEFPSYSDQSGNSRNGKKWRGSRKNKAMQRGMLG